MTDSSKIEKELMDFLCPILEENHYDLVHLEWITRPEKIIRVFIDHASSSPSLSPLRISLDDCSKVSHLLDEPLEQYSLTHSFLNTHYELEISSPGIDRPLRRVSDYQKFIGEKARIYTQRPLNAEELSHTEYCSKNPKQKNFLGTLLGVNKKGDQDLILLSILRKKGVWDEITIPLELITKAHLEPQIDFQAISSNEKNSNPQQEIKE